MKEILITICGRGGSKGVPDKNIRSIKGKPLIGFSFDIARLFAQENNGIVSLSTDSLKIKKVSADLGLSSDYLRPPELASDTSGKISALRHLLFYEENRLNQRFEYILDLDITSPIRTIEDLTNAYQLLRNNPEALNIISVSPARKNPYFNMVEIGPDGYAKIVKVLGNKILYRQQAPIVYEINASFYFYKRRFFEEFYNSALTSRTIIYKMNGTCFDVDDESEFLVMKYLIENDLVRVI